MRSKSLKNQLIVFILISAFVPLLALVIFFYANNVQTARLEDTRFHNDLMDKVAERLDDKAARANLLANQMSSDAGLYQLMLLPRKEMPNSSPDFLSTWQALGNQYRNSMLYEDLQVVMVAGENGADIRFGADAGMFTQRQLEESEWFKQLKNSSGWGPQVQNPWQHSSSSSVIPYLYEYYVQTGGNYGHFLFLFNPRVFTNCYTDITIDAEKKVFEPGGNLFFLLDENTQLIASQPANSAETANGLWQEAFSKSQALGKKNVQFQINYMGAPYMVTTRWVNGGRWLAAEAYCTANAIAQEAGFAGLAILLGVLALGFSVFISVLLSRHLTRPLGVIVHQVNLIGEGDLHVRPLPEAGHTEIVALSRNINLMQKNISQLMDSNIQQEKEKRNIEIRMLQHQINPHFLYNTLNSIKLMATLQGVPGIERMLGALGRIMRYTLGSAQEKVTLREEIAIFEDYMYIQKIRCKGRISWQLNVQDESLLDCLLPRFSLQPIVENSVMHGFAQSGAEGEVSLAASKKDDCLCISIFDNGTGISEKVLEDLNARIYANKPVVKGEGYSIGLHNVQRRIQLLYGEGYGLSVRSKAGSYTKVEMLLKLEKGGHASESTDS